MNKIEFSELKNKEDMIIAFNQLKDDYHQLFEENEILKCKLNNVCFGDGADIELACRYLCKLGYIGYDVYANQYINLHKDDFFDQRLSRNKIQCTKDMEKVRNCEYLVRGMLEFIEHTNKEKNLEKKGENNDAL